MDATIEPPKRSEVRRQEISRAIELTSVRSISHIAKSSGIRNKLIWISTILSCTALAVFQLYNVIQSYISYSINVQVKQSMENPHFPDITVCRINPYNNDWNGQLRYDEYLDIIEDLEESGKLVSMLGSISNKSTDYNSALTYLKSPNGYYANLRRSTDQLYPSDSTLVKTCFFNLWIMDENSAENVSCYKIINISFAPLFGKCVTLHLPLEYVQRIRGITVVLYLEDLSEDLIHFYDERLMLPVDATGLRVIVHSWGTYPDQDLGIDVPAGSEATLDVDEMVRVRLPEPYGKCVDCKYLTENCKERSGALLYSMDACYNLCYQREVIKECGCIDNSAAFTAVELNAVNRSMCGNLNLQDSNPLWNETEKSTKQHLIYHNFTVKSFSDNSIAFGLKQLQCAGAIRSNLTGIKCHCPVPCQEIRYNVGTSQTNWPHRSYELAFYKYSIRGNPAYSNRFEQYESILQANEDGIINDTETLKRLYSIKLIRDNFLRLKVQFAKRGLHVLTDSASMTWDSLMSNVGGTLSLWLDVTAITIVELLELFYGILLVELGFTNGGQKAVVNSNEHITSRL